jgi:hypothetical protein
MNQNCPDECPQISIGTIEPLPLGIEKSLWTELNVSILGTFKRVIQIETHFTLTPHFVKSHACPDVSALNYCDPLQIDFDSGNKTVHGQKLEMNVPFSQAQSPNTYTAFYYEVIGDACTTSIEVRIFP